MKLNNNDDSHNSGLNLLIYNMLLDIESHPTWVCGLKHRMYCAMYWQPMSHPTWVCGLKQCQWKSFPAVQLSHPTWVCGLKHGCVIYINCMRSHTLRGCVDWNISIWILQSPSKVTPYVGVWIETLITCFTSASIKSHPAWEYMDWSIVHSSVKFMEEL